MPQNVWIGGIFLKDEGGYEIVLRALAHYRRRLRAIDKSPEIKSAPMFVQIVKQEALKAVSATEQLIEKIKNALQNSQFLDELQEGIPLIEKALECYNADIKKAHSNIDDFYVEMLSGNEFASSDFSNIGTALKKLKQFS